jgi:hypothetical protein
MRQYTLDNLSTRHHILCSSYKNEDIVVIVDYNFYKIQVETDDLCFLKSFIYLNKHSRVVKNIKDRGETKMFGCNLIMHI